MDALNQSCTPEFSSEAERILSTPPPLKSYQKEERYHHTIMSLLPSFTTIQSYNTEINGGRDSRCIHSFIHSLSKSYIFCPSTPFPSLILSSLHRRARRGRRSYREMRETIRCCISCILPCGALDVVRIVHANGRVEEISRAVKAGEFLQAYPKHVLRKPPSASEELEGGRPRAALVPPNAELQKGKIYFLMPVSSAPEKHRSGTTARTRKKKKEAKAKANGCSTDMTSLLVSDRYLTEILSETVSTHRDRRQGRVAVWRPHLESISEASNDMI